MNHFVPAVIMAVGYSHDIATALLAVSGATLWIISAVYPTNGTSDTARYLSRIFENVSLLGKYALIWIFAAGIPRILFYVEYEWSTAAGDLQLVAVIIKHMVIFLVVGTGLFFWSRLGKKVKLTLQQGG